MSKDIVVEVPVCCDRTGKESKVKMTMEEVADHHAGMQRKAENANLIKETLDGVTEDCPDLIVKFRGETVILPYINPKADSAVLRLLHDLTRSNMFPKPAAKKRAKPNGTTANASSPAK